MKLLLSLNNKIFMNENLIDIIKKHDIFNVVKGFEIYIDLNKIEEKEKVLKLVEESLKEDYIIQLHGFSLENISIETIYENLKYYESISKKYLKKLLITFHPTLEINQTIDIISDINKYIKKNKFNLEISIENLNYLNGIKRINITEIYDIIEKLNNTNITFDIGHYVNDYSNDFSLVNKYLDRINNIHLHDLNEKDEDHYPFYYNKVSLIRSVSFLKSIEYNQNIVLEFGLEYLNGDTFEDKISEYIRQLEYVNILI